MAALGNSASGAHSEAAFEAQVREYGLCHLWVEDTAGPGLGFAKWGCKTFGAFAFCAGNGPVEGGNAESEDQWLEWVCANLLGSKAPSMPRELFTQE